MLEAGVCYKLQDPHQLLGVCGDWVMAANAEAMIVEWDLTAGCKGKWKHVPFLCMGRHLDFGSGSNRVLSFRL